MIREIFLRDSLLWSCVWQSTIFLVVGLVGSFILRHRSSRAHQVLFLAMIAAVIVPIMSILVKHYELGVFVAELVVIQSRAEDRATMSNYGASGIILAEDTEHNLNPIEEDLPSAVASSENARFPWRSVVLCGWIAASLILATRLVVTFVLGVRLLGRALPLNCQRIEVALHLARAKLGIDKDVKVRSSRSVRSPMIWCWRRSPVLLVPSAAGRFDNGVDWAGVFCHELAHWKRRDHISGLFAELVVCILPGHPLVWWAKSRLVRLSEQACDDWVVASGQPGTDYAESLLDLTPQGQMAFVPAVVRSKKGLPGRIQRILQDKCGNPRTGVVWALIVSIVAVCLAAGIALAQTRPANMDEAKIETPQVPDELKNNTLPVSWTLDYDDGLLPDGGKRWLGQMAEDLASLKIMLKPYDPLEKSLKGERYEFRILSLDGKRIGDIHIRPESEFRAPNLKILKPDKYLLKYERGWGKPGDNFRIKCGEFPVDLSRPGMYELRFTPKLGTAEITGSLGGCYAINFEKVGKGPWIRGFAYQHPNKQYLLDGLPAGKYRLSAVTQRQSDNVFVSQAEVTVGAQEKATVDIVPAPTGNCSLKGNIIGKQKKYKTPWPKTWPESQGKWYILIRKHGSGVVEWVDAYEALTMDSLYVVRGTNTIQETEDRTRYQIEGVAPGRYTVTAIENPSWSGCVVTRQQSKPVTLKANQRAVLDFDLRGTKQEKDNPSSEPDDGKAEESRNVEIRVVHFPADRSLGKLYISDPEKSREFGYWFHWTSVGPPSEYLCEAQGDVHVPVGKRLSLTINPTALRDLSPLTKLRPDELHGIAFEYTPRYQTKATDECMQHIARLTGLKSLILRQTNVTDRGIRYIRNLKSLEHLDLPVRITDRGMAYVAELTSLKRLYFSIIDGSSQVTNKGLRYLAKLTNLEELALMGERMGDAGLAHIKDLPRLEYLFIRGSHFGDNGMVHVKNISSLRILSFHEGIAHITDAGLVHISDLPKLESLCLHGMRNITDKGIAHLTKLRSLKKLQIGSSQVSDKGLSYLSQNKTLERLELPQRDQRITDIGLAHLGQLPNLRHLFVSRGHYTDPKMNKVYYTDKGLAELAKCRSLEELSIGSIGITDAGIEHITKLTNLKDLNLFGCDNVTDAGLAKLTALKSLRKLSIYHANLSIAGLNNSKPMPNLTDLKVTRLKHKGSILDISGLTALEDLSLSFKPRSQDEFVDADLICLAKLKKLKWLQIGPRNYTDKGMLYLAGLTNMERLGIGGSGLTDEGLKYLTNMKKLNHLSILGKFDPNKRDFTNGGNITDKGLRYLEEIKSLSFLNIYSDNTFSTAALQRLQRELPNLTSLMINGRNALGRSNPVGMGQQSPSLSQSALSAQARPAKTATEKAEAAESSELHIVHFPKDRSLGTLYIRDMGSESWYDAWERLGESKGDLSIPAKKEVKLEINEEAAGDLSPLIKLRADDLQMLSSGWKPIKIGSLAPIGSLKGLKALNLQSAKFDSEDFKHLTGLRQIEVLRLGDHKLTDRSMEYIGQLTSLRSLALWGTGISDEGLKHLQGLTNLTFLALNGCKITDEGLSYLKNMTALEGLQLTQTKITDEGLAKLKNFNRLKSLLIGHTNITDEGLEHLQGLTSLENIWINSNPITDEGLAYLSGMKNLKELYATGTKITDAGLLNLRGIKDFRHLIIDSIGDEGIAHLSELPALKLLQIRDAQVTEASIPDFKKMESIKEVLLSGDKVDDQLLDALRNALLNCKIWDPQRSREYPMPTWRRRFEAVYRLEDGQILKRITPPFIPERKDYYVEEYRFQASAVSRPPDSFYFHWVRKLKNWGLMFGTPSLDSTLRSVLRLKSYEYDGPKELLAMELLGDWIVRDEASQKEKLAALEQVLADELGRYIRFQKRTVEREVIVATGRFRFRPLSEAPSDNRVYMFSDIFDDRGGGGGTAESVPEFLLALGNQVGIPVIDQTQSPDEIKIPYNHHHSSYLRRVKDKTEKAEKLRMMLDNLTKQTELQFEISLQPMEVWFVTENKEN